MDTLNDSLPVYVVNGANWVVEINLDEDDADLNKEEQAIEAATKACEMVNGVLEPNSTFELEKGSEAPFIGAVILTYLKGTNPDETMEIVKSYVALANGGFYMDSLDAHTAYITETKEIEKQQEIEKGKKDGQLSKKPNKKKKK